MFPQWRFQSVRCFHNDFHLSRHCSHTEGFNKSCFHIEGFNKSNVSTMKISTCQMLFTHWKFLSKVAFTNSVLCFHTGFSHMFRYKSFQSIRCFLTESFHQSNFSTLKPSINQMLFFSILNVNCKGSLPLCIFSCTSFTGWCLSFLLYWCLPLAQLPLIFSSFLYNFVYFPSCQGSKDLISFVSIKCELFFLCPLF